MRRRLGQAWFWAAHTGFAFHWPAAGATAAMTRRRRVARRLMRRRWPWALRPFAAAATVVLWPLGAAIQTRGLFRTAAEREVDIPPVDQPRWKVATAIWWASTRHNMLPLEVAEYGIHRPGNTCPDAWISDPEIVRIWAHLADHRALATAGNKHRFTGFCADEGLPHVETLTYWEGGQQILRSSTPWPDRVILKPASGSNAVGLERWKHADGLFRRDREVLAEAPFLDRARTLSAHYGDLLVQPCLELHPDLVHRGMHGMPTIRIQTGRWPDGTVRLLFAYLATPAPGRFVSNRYRGIKRPVDLETGLVGPSASLLFRKWHGTEPLEGFVLPGWDDMVRHVLHGHRNFPGKVAAMVWDVGLTPSGPVLIETNTGFVFEKPQATTQRPMGEGIVGELLEAWLGQTSRSA